MAQHINRAAGAQAGPSPEKPSGDGKDKDDVIDAEFEVKK
jgi:hypothetical protein